MIKSARGGGERIGMEWRKRRLLMEEPTSVNNAKCYMIRCKQLMAAHIAILYRYNTAWVQCDSTNQSHALLSKSKTSCCDVLFVADAIL